MIRISVLICIVILLGSCSTYDRNPASKYSEPVKDGCGESTGKKSRIETLFYASCMKPTDPSLAKEYLDFGVILVDTTCSKYLDALYDNDNDQKFSKEMFNALIVLGTGILAVNGAPSEDFTRVALGSAALNTSFDLYGRYYLLGATPSVVHNFVSEGLTSMRGSIEASSPRNFNNAQKQLSQFSDICTMKYIRDAVDSAIKQNKISAQEIITAVETKEWQALKDIAALLGAPMLGQDQLLGVYWLVSRKVETTTSTQIEGNLLSPILAADVLKNASDLQDLFLETPKTTSVLAANLKSRLTIAQKEKNSSAVTTTDITVIDAVSGLPAPTPVNLGEQVLYIPEVIAR